jgi:hypothetical protein
VFTDPESITGINATYISDTEITLTWDLPEGEYNAFEVKIHLSYRIISSLSLLPSRWELPGLNHGQITGYAELHFL